MDRNQRHFALAPGCLLDANTAGTTPSTRDHVRAGSRLDRRSGGEMRDVLLDTRRAHSVRSPHARSPYAHRVDRSCVVEQAEPISGT